MFGSHALEVTIALALLFFILATTASAIVEAWNRWTSVRAKQLEAGIIKLVTGGTEVVPAASGWPRQLQTMLNLGANRANASYVSAKAFADAAIQLVDKIPSGPAASSLQPLYDKLETLSRQAKGDITTVKAGLETWFDDRMTDLQSQFKRYASIFVFVVGLVITIAANASSINVAQHLWEDAPARQAAVAAAERATSETPTTGDCAEKDGDIAKSACAVSALEEAGMPLGWDANQRAGWWDGPTKVTFWTWWISHLLGWALTAFLLMLGAPFWFDLLGRLVSARSARVKPASEDPGSNTALLAATPAGPLSGGGLTDLMTLYQAPQDDLRRDLPRRDTEVDWLAVALNRPNPVPRPGDPAP